MFKLYENNVKFLKKDYTILPVLIHKECVKIQKKESYNLFWTRTTYIQLYISSTSSNNVILEDNILSKWFFSPKGDKEMR